MSFEVIITDNLEIREMLPGDRALIEEFFAQMSEKSTSFFNVNHGNEKRVLGGFDGTTKGHTFFVAVKDKSAVGIMFIWDIDKTIPWFGIAVRDNMQGQGIGSSMMNYLKAYCKENRFGGVLLRTAKTNIGAQRLYEKSGFERLGEHPSGEYLYLLRFEKR